MFSINIKIFDYFYKMSTDSSCTYENLVSFLNDNDFESLNNIILSSNLYYEPFIIQIIPDLLLKTY